MPLQPYQYSLGGVVFGRDTQIPVAKCDLQPYNVNNQDFQVQRADENRFGVDTLTPSPIMFTMSVMNNYELYSMSGLSNTHPNLGTLFAGNNTLLNSLAAAWKNTSLRMTWGATIPLLFCDKNGNVRRIYGRPGKFVHAPRNKQGESWIDVQAEFRRADTMSHSDIEYGVGPLSPGGSATAVRQGGDADAWLRVLITGPATNPTITYGSQTIQTNSVIPSGVTAEISSYPWARRYIDDQNVNRRTEIIGSTLYLDQIKFAAGASINVGWTASGTGGGSAMTFAWREASNVI